MIRLMMIRTRFFHCSVGTVSYTLWISALMVEKGAW